MATEAVDSDDEYLYGREGQNITTPPPEPEQEEAIPPSTEMAEVAIADESLPNPMEEGPATPSPDEPGEDTLEDGHSTMVADTPTDSAAPELKPAEGGGLQDSHVPVIQQSPRDTAGDTTANAGASSDEDDNVDSSEDDENENVLIKIGEGNQLTTSAAVKLTTDYSLSASYRPSVPSAQISKQLDINAVGKVNGVSIYDYDIDASFDEKPWRKPGADITDYFNYGFTEETWKAYSLKQKQMRQDYKAPPTILEDTINEEIRVIGEKPIIKQPSELGPLPELPPPMFNPFMHMPPPGMPHMGPMLPPVVGVPQLDPFVLGGVPPPMPMPPPGMHPFQHDPGRDGMFQPPFPPPGGFRDPGLFPDPHLYPDLMQDFMAMEKRNHTRSPSFSPRRRPSLETLSANSFSSDGSHGRSRAMMRDDSHRLREYKRHRHSPRDHRHKEHRESRDNRERERERDRDRERDQRDREKEYRSHERSRHRGQEVMEKHERMRERDPRERVVKRLGDRGAVTNERESRSRHERKKHREVGGHDGSPSRRRPKKSRHGTDGSPLP